MTPTEFKCNTCGLILEQPHEGGYRECIGCTTLYKTVDGKVTVAREAYQYEN